MKEQPLHISCRPKSWDEVIGQSQLVRSIQSSIKSGAQSFLLTGPSGVGKTSIGRLIAKEVGCLKANLIEIDAATNSGVDAMRLITEAANFNPLGGGSKVVIVDECHALSSQAWQSLLKSIEEPPQHVYWVLCTTERGKVPTTIQTRCHDYDLNRVSALDLVEFLKDVVARREITLQVSDLIDIAVEQASGSPRQALVNLSKIKDCKTAKQAERLLEVVREDDAEAIDLCRALMNNKPWGSIAEILRKLDGKNPESVRIVVFAYMSKVVLGGKPSKRFFAILDAFSEPYPAGSKSAGYLALSAGMLYFGG